MLQEHLPFACDSPCASLLVELGNLYSPPSVCDVRGMLRRSARRCILSDVAAVSW